MSLGWISQFGMVGPEHVDPAVVVNVRALQEFDVWDGLERRKFNGADFGLPYEKPEFTGEEPEVEVEVEDARVYYGACHCGAVRLAVKVPTLDGGYEGRVVECNCSHCNRVRA